MKKVYETGEGPVKIRAKYRYDKAANCIDILEIPYSTTIEIIMKKIAEMMKANFMALKLSVDFCEGADEQKIMKAAQKAAKKVERDCVIYF